MRVDIPSRSRRLVAQLIDPDHSGEGVLSTAARLAAVAGTDLFLVGGSLTGVPAGTVIRRLKQLTAVPVVLFPGDLTQLTTDADAILFLSLISGRNPELLIGRHVIAAPFLRGVREKVIPVGYMLIGSGGGSSVEYMSQTAPIPAGKSDIAVATALAGEMLGMRGIYLEGGSGTDRPVPAEIISAVREAVSVPLITGGGLDTETKIEEAFAAGADMIVVGNSCERDPEFIITACRVRDRFNNHSA